MKSGTRRSILQELLSRERLALVMILLGVYFVVIAIFSRLSGAISLFEFLSYVAPLSTALILVGLYIRKHEIFGHEKADSELDVREKLDLITRNAEEIVTLDELTTLVSVRSRPKAYWGFEGKGLMHIGMGLICGNKIKDLIKAGFEVTILLADVHSWISEKYEGDMAKIRICGEYYEHCFASLGIPPSKVRFVWTSDLAKDPGYWRKVIEIGKNVSLHRTLRALPILDRQVGQENINAADISYVCMQVADVFQIGVDVACGGLDQRKAHMLSRDIAPKLRWKKPIALHVPLLSGLAEPREFGEVYDEDPRISRRIMNRMSKEFVGSTLYIHDSPEEIRRKILGAYCPPKEIQDNPIMEIIKLIIFPQKSAFELQRDDKHGGKIHFSTYKELAESYRRGEIHPLDLKSSVAESLIELLGEVRRYFERNSESVMAMKEIEEQVRVNGT